MARGEGDEGKMNEMKDEGGSWRLKLREERNDFFTCPLMQSVQLCNLGRED